MAAPRPDHRWRSRCCRDGLRRRGLRGYAAGRVLGSRRPASWAASRTRCTSGTGRSSCCRKPSRARLDGPRLARVALMVVVATATQRWLEDPIRHGRFVGLKTRRSLAMAGGLSVAVVAMTASLGFAAGAVSPGGAAVGGEVTSVALPPDPTPTPIASETAGPDGSPPEGATSPPATPTPVATLPPLAAAPVPADLAPPLEIAADDLPVIYSDDCHLECPPSRRVISSSAIPPATSPSCCSVIPTPPRVPGARAPRDRARLAPRLDDEIDVHHRRRRHLQRHRQRTYDEMQPAGARPLVGRMAAERPDLVIVSGSRGSR